ncbi:MAG: hypothetical protein JST30_11475 [Armatimonadetes bacterium]|nr:hypothetical protein [Armatimonadota bacterium]
MNHEKNYRCFVSAPYNVDTAVLRSELARQNVEWVDVTKVHSHSTVVAAIRAGIRKCDFLCIVFPPVYEGRWTMLEAGIAIGSGKPLLIIVDPKTQIPIEFSSYHVVLAAANDAEAIRFNLEAFLASLHRRRSESTSARRVRASVTQRPHKQWHSAAESEIARMFEEAGYLIRESKPSTGPPQVDFAVWIDELSSVFSSPLLAVEVKGGPIKSDAVAQVSRFLEQSGAGIGLIVTVATAEPGPPLIKWRRLAGPPFVFEVSLETLKHSLADGEFVTELVRSRNAAVHGG